MSSIIDKSGLSLAFDPAFCKNPPFNHAGGSSLAVIVPCFNEFSRMPYDQFSDFLKQHRSISFCFVNDASTDSTTVLLKKLLRLFPAQVSVVNLEKNVGKAEAIRQGMLFISGTTRPGFIAFLDADLSTPLVEMLRLFEVIKVENLLFVFGSRVAVYGSKINRIPLRHYMGRIFATFASMLLNMVVYDTQCGVKIFHNDLVLKLFEKSFISRWLFDVELLARLKLIYSSQNLKKIMKEIPLYEWVEKGDSRITISQFFLIPYYLIYIRHHYKKQQRLQKLTHNSSSPQSKFELKSLFVLIK